MTAATKPHEDCLPIELPADERGRLLWRIARRADELVKESSRSPGLNRVCWLLAEQELLGREASGSPLPTPAL